MENLRNPSSRRRMLISAFAVVLVLRFAMVSSKSQDATDDPPTSETERLRNVMEVLGNSTYTAMALTLELTSHRLLRESGGTVFSPTDAAFALYGQPPLMLLDYHVTTRRFTSTELCHLPFGTRIQTLLPRHCLVMTSTQYGPPSSLSFNKIRVKDPDLYDDGLIAIHGVESFLDPTFPMSMTPVGTPLPIPGSLHYDLGQCWSAPQDSIPERPTEELGLPTMYVCPGGSISCSLQEAASVLRKKGYAIVATVLELQITGLPPSVKITLFCPNDESFLSKHVPPAGYSALLRYHIIPRRLAFSDFIYFPIGTRLETLLPGHTLNITRFGRALAINNVPVAYPDLYYDEFIAVHGLHELFMDPKVGIMENITRSDSSDGVSVSGSGMDLDAEQGSNQDSRAPRHAPAIAGDTEI